MKNLLKASLMFGLLCLVSIACNEDEDNENNENQTKENFIQIGDEKYSLSQGILDYRGRITFNDHDTKHHYLELLTEGMAVDSAGSYCDLDKQSTGLKFGVTLRSSDTDDPTEQYLFTHSIYTYSRFSLEGSCGLILSKGFVNGVETNEEEHYEPKEISINTDNDIFTVSFNGNHTDTNDTIFGYFQGDMDEFNPDDLINPDTGEFDGSLSVINCLTIN